MCILLSILCNVPIKPIILLVNIFLSLSCTNTITKVPAKKVTGGVIAFTIYPWQNGEDVYRCIIIAKSYRHNVWMLANQGSKFKKVGAVSFNNS